MNQRELIRASGLTKHFEIKSVGFGARRALKAVDGVDLTIHKGETLGIVGESGCGKSTLGRVLLRLQDPTSGSIMFDGTDITAMSGRQLRSMRKDFQMIFQDPYASLDPRMSIRRILEEPLKAFGKSKSERQFTVEQLIESVGLSITHLDRSPHEFSGGQRQRIGIARALALRPKFIVADEPVAALDVSIQAQVLNLLKDLQKLNELTYLFISHNLNVVEYLSDRIAVMYLGSIVELSTAEELYTSPMHPYTQSLFSAIPDIEDKAKVNKIRVSGEVPSPLSPPSGCRFHTRCPIATERCRIITPELRDIGQEHLVACDQI